MTIKNWTGIVYTPSDSADGAGLEQDRLLFTTDPGLTPGQLAGINFFGDNGVAIGSGAKEISFGGLTEIVPIPEPSPLMSLLTLMGLVGLRERRRLRGMVRG